MPGKKIIKQKAYEKDNDFESRNWFDLARFVRLGHSLQEAKRIMRDIEAGKTIFRGLNKNSL